jgi:hypothetical protein
MAKSENAGMGRKMPFMDGHELASAGATRPHPHSCLPATLSSGSLLKGWMLEGWEAWKLDGANKIIGFPATVLS